MTKEEEKKRFADEMRYFLYLISPNGSQRISEGQLEAIFGWIQKIVLHESLVERVQTLEQEVAKLKSGA